MATLNQVKNSQAFQDIGAALMGTLGDFYFKSEEHEKSNHNFAAANKGFAMVSQMIKQQNQAQTATPS